MDDTQRILKCGNLSLHSPGGFFKKRWHGKYLVLYDGSKSGVKRLELFDSEIKFKKQNPAKIIPLVDCVRVVTCQRQKSSYTFEVRTSDQFYLLAAQSFQDMNDWVNCLRLVAFGQPQSSCAAGAKRLAATAAARMEPAKVDVLLDEKRPSQVVASAMGGGGGGKDPLQVATASQAAAAAASALARTRQRQPSLLGSCKPQPPTDSPFIQQAARCLAPTINSPLANIGQLDTMTPTVRGQLILASNNAHTALPTIKQATLDEEEENMLYCSIEDNPSEHNYRVKVIETELSLRCQLKCYQLTAPTTISQQYEQLGPFNTKLGVYESQAISPETTSQTLAPQVVTFYQLIIGPQELTLLNDYAIKPNNQQQQQGLWSWPYQCIRRYGFDKDNCFMFEAGRKCTSGPGQFIVQTPKAYNIYSDVVKFVNELRSLNNPVEAANNSAPPHLVNNQKQNIVVTQIPVNWTPNGEQNSPPEEKKSISETRNEKIAAKIASNPDTRQQFFNALRQLDGNPNNTNQITNTKSTSQTIQLADRIVGDDENQAKLKKLEKNNRSPEETDESGYDQGDDSVDSSTSRFKLLATTRKRQTTKDSMSSASSTTSSTSSTGSPAQSVARRSSIDDQKGQSMIQKTKEAHHHKSKGSGNRSLGIMGVLKDQETFEANLIRDVYSEITKLHAKFAVTSASGEDSMSSNGSSLNDEGSNEASSSNGANDNEDYLDKELRSEPMYSNLGSDAALDMRNQVADYLSDEEDHGKKNFKLQNLQTQNSYSINTYEYLSTPRYNPIYPTVLNPIPECGELAAPKPPKIGPKPDLRWQSNSQSNLVASRNRIADNNNSKWPPNQNSQSAKLHSNMPTNHYLINDVQYAKISRANIRASFESIL